MDDFLNSAAWNTMVLIVLGFIAIYTREIVTFVMLGFIIIILTNIFSVLKVISHKLDTKTK